ncbi:MAG: Hsp70 family protein [Actinomycetota bacterium]|nr:Hsp70 family protein [Actinomycetota bacterium]
MRDTIDFGIDLGTTNSAIAVFADGEVSVVKNNDGWDYTPSAVWIPKPGAVRVGRAARDHPDHENVHTEFKLEMGLDGAVRHFPKGDTTLTPQQLSAEVLKSLRADAQHQFGDAPQAAVITVPAAFRLHQNNATSEAATLAGFAHCPLVQEPTAAAFAYGFQNESSDAYWMVFDFGGGTFDAAVVSTYEGELRVLDHVGDPHMGGKLIDWAIVEHLLAPVVAREFGFDHFTRDNRRWAGAFARLKKAAENAKIALSRSESTDVDVDLVVGSGRIESFSHTLRRGEVDQLAEPFYIRAINLCRDALTKANLEPDNIDRLLLVGGATLAPGLRERLGDPDLGLGITLDHTQDPTTVVARGAAVFASTVALDQPLAAPLAGEFTAELTYPRTTSLVDVPVAGRFHSAVDQDWTRYKVVIGNPKGKPPFTTPQITLDSGGAFVAEVQVDELTASTFTVTLLNPQGGQEKVVPNTLTVKHWLNEPGGAVLTNPIGIAQADKTFAPMLAKGARLPAVSRDTFHTTVALLRSDADAVIRIPIMEGERERADRNLLVGVIEIRPKDVSIDLPKGSDVEVTIEIDESRLLTVVADVPLVEEQFEAEIDLSKVSAPDSRELRRELADVERRWERLRESADRSGSSQARARFARMEEERLLMLAHDEVRAAGGDNGVASAADERLRTIQAELDTVESDVRLPALLAELTTALDSCRELVGRLGDADNRAEFAEMERKAELARRSEDTAAIEDLLLHAADMQMVLLKRDGSWDVTIFYYFREHQHELTSPGRAKSLIDEGELAIARSDYASLPGVNQRLRMLLPSSLPDPTGGIQRQAGPGRRG